MAEPCDKGRGETQVGHCLAQLLQDGGAGVQCAGQPGAGVQAGGRLAFKVRQTTIIIWVRKQLCFSKRN